MSETATPRRGRQTSVLSPEYRAVLAQYRLDRALSLAALRRAIGCPFVPETLGKALEGLPVYDLYIVWLERWVKRQHAEKTP